MGCRNPQSPTLQVAQRQRMWGPILRKHHPLAYWSCQLVPLLLGPVLTWEPVSSEAAGLGWAGLEPGPCPLWKVTGRSQAVCRAKRPAVWSQCCQVTAGLTTWRP